MDGANMNKDVESAKDKPPDYGAPPTYEESVLSKIKKAKEESDGNKELAHSLLAIICGSVSLIIGCLICTGITAAIPIAMIVIGSMYKDDCNAQPYIPIYLIVAGSCSLFSLATSVGGCRSKYRENDEEKQKKGTVGNCCGCISGLVSLFMMCWFITGSVWIYKAHEPSYEDPTASDYCDKTLYLFSFWMLNVGYMVVGLCCCAGLLGLCCKLKARNEQ